MRTRLFIAFTLLLCALPASADYLHELQAAARKAGLARTGEWLALGHWRPNLLRAGHTSLADAPAFFNAPGGKTDPQAELDATLAAFFAPGEETPTWQHPQCRFIARYSWLKERLHFEAMRLPEKACTRFENWYAAIAPRQLTLVFPAAYMNNPSSMFGHTLLRVDTSEQSDGTRLFSYALNYAAETNDTNGMVFAVKGLLGGYPGYFTITPYYAKVKEYNDLENRDLWEYELAFTPAEIRRLLEHAWELGQVNFDYFFFDENCSYQLLALLDVARPGHHLAERFPAWAIPSDTVRAVLQEEGLLTRVQFRPALATRIRHQVTVLGDDHGALARTVAETPERSGEILQGMASVQAAQVLDLAYDYLQYRAADEDLPREYVAPRALALLRARSALPTTAAPVPRPPAVRPDQGHGTARVVLGTGARDGIGFTELRLRPAYHDLVDPQSGYSEGAQINFFDIAARWYPDENDHELRWFRFVDIVSLSPRDAFFQPLSWRFTAALERRTIAGDELPFSISAGVGGAWQLRPRLLGFALAELDILAEDDLPDGYAVGAGPLLGLYATPTDRLALLAGARARRYTGLWTHEAEAFLQAGYELRRDLAARVELTSTHLEDDQLFEGGVSLHWYF